MPEEKKATNPEQSKSGMGGKSRRKYHRVPLFPLDGIVVFPYTLSPLVIEDEGAIQELEKIVSGKRLIALFPQVPSENENNIDTYSDPVITSFSCNERELCRTGVLARIVKMLRFPDETVRLLVRGLKRVHFESFTRGKFSHTAKVLELSEIPDNNIETIAVARNAMTQFQEIVSISPNFPEELKIAILNVDDNIRLVDLIADTLNISFAEKLHILAIPNLSGRLQLLSILLNREVEVLHVGSEIQSQVNDALSQTQREYYLREQLRTIKKELGEESRNPDIAMIEDHMGQMLLPEEVEQVIRKEMERLEMIPQASAEYNVAHTYIDWLLSVPWNNFTTDQLDLKKATKILDADHYDLKDVKERILEFLAVLQLKKDRKSPILCFIGPPGVGKTSLGQSIARAMERNFVRISLGGVKDEAEIRGHRRTYVGALPGRIIQGIKKAKSSNPVFMLDEIDKVGNDFRGDPASALLEVLDPQQNYTFNDHYLELDYNLSSVMFIATANITDTIPPALLDRMELIHLPGYTLMEKKQISRRFLIPRQLKENGLKQRQLFFPMETIDEIITFYTREAGVRVLERTLAGVCRKVARNIVEGKLKATARTVVKPTDLQTYLGPGKYFQDEAEKYPEVGTAVGMAWTSVGGSILPVEVTSMPGRGNLQLTGCLGEVMKESAQAAFSLVRNRHRDYDLDAKKFNRQDFHIHVPDGATPKDGPSAGITMFTALVSHLTGRAVRPEVAMTGEITLRGKITPVGGIKEKVIAALRAGIKDVVLPEQNRKDLTELPEEVKKSLEFHFFSKATDALDYLLINSSREKSVTRSARKK